MLFVEDRHRQTSEDLLFATTKLYKLIYERISFVIYVNEVSYKAQGHTQRIQHEAPPGPVHRGN